MFSQSWRTDTQFLHENVTEDLTLLWLQERKKERKVVTVFTCLASSCHGLFYFKTNGLPPGYWQLFSLVLGKKRQDEENVWMKERKLEEQTVGTLSDGGADPAGIFSRVREARRCWITQRGHKAVCHLISALAGP